MKTRKRKLSGGAKKIVFYTCFFGKNGGKGDTAPPLPSKHYNCYFFSNNRDTLQKAETAGYKIVYIDIPIKNTNRDNAVDSKELKACPHHFAELKGYEYTCYYDATKPVDETFVLEQLPKLDGDKCMLLKFHESIKNSVRHEFNEAMKQTRYSQNRNKYTRHINNRIKNGYKNVFKHHFNTGFIIRKSGDTVDKIGDDWFDAIKETGAECQITFFFIQQKYDKYIVGI